MIAVICSVWTHAVDNKFKNWKNIPYRRVQWPALTSCHKILG